MHLDWTRSIVRACALFASILLAAGCDRQPRGDVVSHDVLHDADRGRISSENAPAEPAFQPLPAQPSLREIEAGTYVWGEPDHDESRRVRVLFENGTEGELRVGLAPDHVLTVPPFQRATLYTHIGAVQFDASDRELPDAASFHVVANAGDLWIYNHRSAWDYLFRKIQYSTIPAFGDRDGSERLFGPLLFRAGHIDYLFAPPPEKVEVVTFGSVGQATKTELQHLEELPAAGRSTRRIASGDREEYHVVSDEAGETVHVHRMGASVDDGRARVYVDHAWPDSTGAVTVELFGQRLAELQPGALLTLNLPARKSTLAIRTARGELVESREVEASPGGRYVWCPGGRREYTIDFHDYSIGGFGIPSVAPKGPSEVSCRGLRFFRSPVPLMFVSFPETHALPAYQFQARVGRITQGTTGEFQQDLAAEWDRLRETARRELSPELFERFARETAPADAELLSDCDLWLAEGWLQSTQGDDEAVLATFDRLLQFQPDLAPAYKLRGLSAARLARYRDALDDLRTAVSRDGRLAAELDPKIQEIERLREQVAAEAQTEGN